MFPLGKSLVSETCLELLLIEIVNYFLNGKGACSYAAPDGSTDRLTEDEKKASTIESRARLEALGIDIGKRLIERLTADRNNLDTELEVVKYICKDFWEYIFKKQVDVLKTNHKGLFVLQDTQFRWLSKISETTSKGTKEDYIIFPCGIVEGALTRLGIKCRVTAEMHPANPSACSFLVQMYS